MGNNTFEQQVIKLVLMHPDDILKCGRLEAKHFADAQYGELYTNICDMYHEGDIENGKINMIGLSAKMGKPWVHNKILSTMSDVVINGGGAHLSKAIVDAYVGRTAKSIINMYNESSVIVNRQQEALSGLIEALSSVVDNKSSGRMKRGDEIAYELMERLSNPDKGRLGVKTGINGLDNLIGGVQKSLLTVVSGIPGMGKSMFMANVIFNMALAGERVFVASLEDKSESTIGRMISRLSGVNAEDVNKGMNITPDKIRKLEETIKRNVDAFKRINSDDGSCQSVKEIRRKTKQLIIEEGVSVVFVDHMGELSKQGRDKYDSATLNAEGLRDMANDFGIPVIAAAQVARSAVSQVTINKNLPKHMNYIPRPHHLRDSGRIEEVARSIYFVHRPSVWDHTMDKDDFWVSVAKQTHGQTGYVELGVNMATMSIYTPVEPGID